MLCAGSNGRSDVVGFAILDVTTGNRERNGGWRNRGRKTDWGGKQEREKGLRNVD